jgi:hypothetical protein
MQLKKSLRKLHLGNARSYNTLIERQTNFAPANMDSTAFISYFEGL